MPTTTTSSLFCVPKDDFGARTWLENFARLLPEAGEIRGALGISDEQVAEIVECVQAYTAAYMAATTPATRTQSTVATKNDARNAAVEAVRGVVNRIRYSPRITEAQRLTLGIQPLTTAADARRQRQDAVRRMNGRHI